MLNNLAYPLARLNVLLRRVAALVLAAGLRLHLVFVPSAHNPSDPPSRGGPATWPRALRLSTRYGARGGLREERRLMRRERAEALREARRLAPLMSVVDRYQRAASLLRKGTDDEYSDSSEASLAACE